jgi:putative ABC transport system substrate-binding protein
MMRRLFMRLVATLWLILVILSAALSARAQTPRKVPHVGYLWLGAEGSDFRVRPGFRQGLRELGYHEGRDIVIEYRNADGSMERLRELVADTVASKVDIIFVPGLIVAEAVKRATSTIPTVALVGDPLTSGLVNSLARPGGNITGLSSMMPAYGGKLVELLREVVPNATRAALLWNPLNGSSRQLVQVVRDAAEHVGLSLLQHEGPADFTVAFDAIIGQQPDALIVDTDILLLVHRRSIVDYAALRRLPAVCGFRDFTDDGGLMSFGPDTFDDACLAAGYVDRIVKTAKPADLPFQQPTKFELAINLRTARTLGLTIPPNLLAVTDEVIE